MINNNPLPPRPLATLHLTGLGVPAQLQVAQTVLSSMTGNPAFSTPVPPLSVLSGTMGELSTAQTAAVARTHGAVSLRNEKRLALISVLGQLQAYVQGVADANATTGASIIESAGMSLRKKPERPPRVFSMRQGPVSGTVLIRTAAAAPRASYEWQYSLDGGKTWVGMPPTLQAKTRLTGLVPQTVVEVKYRAITRAGADDWSPAIAFTVQ